MIVTDTNIIVYLWLRSPHTDIIKKLAETDPDWLAPRLWRSEFRNALTAYIRKGFLSLRDATWIAEKAESQFSKYEFDVDSSEVLNLVQKSACSSYDCEFVALAQILKVPLITYDKLILKEFPAFSSTAEQYLSTL